jgi:hypothetical protein
MNDEESDQAVPQWLLPGHDRLLLPVQLHVQMPALLLPLTEGKGLPDA